MDDDELEDDLSENELESEELPEGWEEGITESGKVFYVCHSTRSTQWTHPTTHRMRVLSKQLPDGWVKREDGMFIDSINSTASRIDPRLHRAPKHSDFLGSCERVNVDGRVVRTLRNTFHMSSTADDVLLGIKMDGRVAIVTGATSGLGFEVARSLAHHGAHVILACRCMASGHLARQRIADERAGCAVDVMEIDLASSQSIRIFAADFKRKNLPLHIVVCNAAVLGLEYRLIDGVEAHFAINHLSHFLLVKLLLPVMIHSAPCRVVVVTAESHRYPSLSSQQPASARALLPSAVDYWSVCAYNTSKLCNLLFMKQLNALYFSQGVFCNAVHPGNLISTSLGRNSFLHRAMCAIAWPFTRSPAQAAAGIVYCAVTPDLEHVGGTYFVDNMVSLPATLAQSQQLAEDLWAYSEELTGTSEATTLTL